MNRSLHLLGILLWSAAVGACLAQSDPALIARLPAQELASFRLADPQLAVELVAAEPDVVSPVCIAWDADGRLFVVEMSDYPNASDKGRVKLLEDRDGDGRYERVTLFAEALPFPNSVLPWNGGVLVTAAPDIWFFKDTDGDGRADERRVLFTGFGEGNQQLRVNGLRWGIDNWVYGANGRSDGEVHRPNDPPGNTFSIRRRDFRFKADTGEFEAIAGSSQFGCAADDWGNRFLSWNTIPIRHVVIEERYLNRNPHLSDTTSSQDLLPPNDTQEVFPLTPPPLVFNEESSSHFNALAGLTIYRGDALGRDPDGHDYRGNAFMGESLRNLVHRRILVPSGPTFVAQRGEHRKEFLASTDPWFHPVNFATGPDGALYVVDFYRRFVEHPNYVHDPSVTNRIPWRTGAEHGRIWRVRSTNSSLPRPAAPARLADAPASDLVQGLTAGNGWVRDTAQRLLVERRDKTAVDSLRKLVIQPNAQTAAIHALRILDALGALDTDTLLSALRPTAHPALVVNALQLAERRLESDSALRAATLRWQATMDAPVQLQLALALGELTSNERRTQKYDALMKLPHSGQWQQRALLSSMNDQPWLGLARVLTPASGLVGEGKIEPGFAEKLASLVGARQADSDLDECAARLTDSAIASNLRIVVLAGLAEGMGRSNHSFRQWLDALKDRSPQTSEELAALLKQAAQLASQTTQSVPVRVTAVRLLGNADPTLARSLILELLSPGTPNELQLASVRAVVRLDDPALCKAIFANWSLHTQGTRRQFLAESPRSTALAAALLESLQGGHISVLEIAPGTRDALRRIPDQHLREGFADLLKNPVSSDRSEVLRRFEPSAQMNGDVKRGADTFNRLCLQCHTVKGVGGKVGPDLSAVGTRPKAALLMDILDPSRAVSPDFLSYTLETKSGETVTGLIAAETTTHITIRRPLLPDEIIDRTRLQTLKADGKSLMPDGLEQGLSEHDLADLLAFLKQPDATLLK